MTLNERAKKIKKSIIGRRQDCVVYMDKDGEYQIVSVSRIMGTYGRGTPQGHIEEDMEKMEKRRNILCRKQ